MAKDDVTAEVNGLQLSNSTFSASPPGSLLRAEECVMPQKGVVEPRPGQARRLLLPSATSVPFQQTVFESTIVASYAPNKESTSYGLGYDAGGGSISAYSGTFNPVDTDGSTSSAARMKFAQANQYLYFCTTAGPMALEAVNGTPRPAGLLRMPDPVLFMASPASYPIGVGEGLDYGDTRAYRSLLRLPTANGTDVLSPPSGRVLITNRLLAPIGAMTRTLGSGTTVTVTFPSNLTTQIGLDVGDAFDLDPGELNFPAGPYTVASVTDNVITYIDAHAAVNASNTVAQDFDTGPRAVAIEPLFSSDVTTETPVAIYRSRDTSTGNPDDELFLDAERLPDAGEVAAGFMLFVDTTPQSVTNDPLYTNPLTGEGAAAANLKPPLYRDVSNWSGSTWYANTTGFQELRIQLLGVGLPDGVQNNDTLTIDGEIFTFKTSAGGAGQVQIVSNGTPFFNIEQTTHNLISQIEQVMTSAAKSIAAYYEGASDSPGAVLIQATAYDEAAFTVTASRIESWVPALPVDTVAERLPNTIAFSKPGQPEAVPALNYVPIGSKSYPIGRILGMRQSLLVFKEGDGVWSVSGVFPFNVQQISTANIIARDTGCVFADAAWAYTDQGFLRVSDAGGVTVVSRPIETALNEQFGFLPDETRDYAFCVPMEQARRVLLFVPFDFELDLIGGTSDSPVLRAWCYNNATQAWTGPLYDLAFSGQVAQLSTARPQLVLGVYDEPWATTRITAERIAGVARGAANAHLDYADASFSVSISAVEVGGDPLIVQLSSLTDIEAGDILTQAETSAGIGRQSVIAEIRDDLGTGYVELYEERTWTVASASVFKHYDVTLQFLPQGNPAARKALTRLSWLFKPEWYYSPNAETIISTDQTQADMPIDSPSVGFGSNPFGSVPFGDPSPLVLDVNPPDPRSVNAAQFFVGLRVPVCFSKLKLQGFAARLETADGPDGRGK